MRQNLASLSNFTVSKPKPLTSKRNIRSLSTLIALSALLALDPNPAAAQSAPCSDQANKVAFDSLVFGDVYIVTLEMRKGLVAACSNHPELDTIACVEEGVNFTYEEVREFCKGFRPPKILIESQKQRAQENEGQMVPLIEITPLIPPRKNPENNSHSCPTREHNYHELLSDNHQQRSQ